MPTPRYHSAPVSRGALLSCSDDLRHRDAEELASRLVTDPDEAIRSLPPDEGDAYQAARSSVVEARRGAEAKEGLLRVG
jgi:hypothetical protein